MKRNNIANSLTLPARTFQWRFFRVRCRPFSLTSHDFPELYIVKIPSNAKREFSTANTREYHGGLSIPDTTSLKGIYGTYPFFVLKRQIFIPIHRSIRSSTKDCENRFGIFRLVFFRYYKRFLINSYSCSAKFDSKNVNIYKRSPDYKSSVNK